MTTSINPPDPFNLLVRDLDDTAEFEAHGWRRQCATAADELMLQRRQRLLFLFEKARADADVRVIADRDAFRHRSVGEFQVARQILRGARDAVRSSLYELNPLRWAHIVFGFVVIPNPVAKAILEIRLSPPLPSSYRVQRDVVGSAGTTDIVGNGVPTAVAHSDDTAGPLLRLTVL